MPFPPIKWYALMLLFVNFQIVLNCIDCFGLIAILCYNNDFSVRNIKKNSPKCRTVQQFIGGKLSHPPFAVKKGGPDSADKTNGN